MAGTEGSERLSQTKQALIAESTLNRIELRMQVEKLRSATARLDSVFGVALRMGPWLVPLVSLLGIWTGRKLRRKRVESDPGSRPVWMSLIRLVPTALSLWQRFGRKNTAGND